MLGSLCRAVPWAAWAVSLALLSTTGSARAACPEVPGDINGNGSADIVDVQCAILLVLHVLGAQPGAPCPACLGVPEAFVDMDCNQDINVGDVLSVVGRILGQPPAGDSDGDGCPDACGLPTPFTPAWAVGESANGGYSIRAATAEPGMLGTSSGGGITLKTHVIGIQKKLNLACP